MIRYLVFAFSIVILSSCQKFKEPIYQKYEDFRIESIGSKNVTLSVNVILNNPNTIGLNLMETDLDCYINDKYLGKAIQNKQVKINKKSDFTIPFTIVAPTSTLLSEGLNLTTKKEVKLGFKGYIKVSKFAINKKIAINNEQIVSF